MNQRDRRGGLRLSYREKVFRISIHKTREEMGFAAAFELVSILIEKLKTLEEVNVVFATGLSQLEFLDALVKIPFHGWDRVNAFHLDEYIGLPAEATQRFSNFLKNRLFDRLRFKNVYYVVSPGQENEDAQNLARKYEQLLLKHPLHIACIGIGENGHIAFNEPNVADYNDKHLVRVIELDERSRNQQLAEGWFKTIEEVPTHAITLTVPAILSAEKILCIVPRERKKEIVLRTLEGPITAECPASFLRRHRDVHLFLDEGSASFSSL